KPVEEKKVEEPKKEEKPVEEKKAEEPKKEEKPVEEKKAEEPKKEEKPVEEKKAEEPKKEEKKAEKPKKEKKVAEEKEEKPALHRKPSFIVALLSIILCLVIFIATVCAGVIGSLRMTYSEKKVVDTIEKIEVATDTLPSLDGTKELSVVKFLSDAAGFDFEKSAGISNSNLEKFLSKSYVKEEVAELVGGIVGYFMEGKEPEPITAKSFLDFIEKHNDDLLELTGFSFVYTNPETGAKMVYDVDVNNAFKDLGTKEVSMDYIKDVVKDESGVDLDLVKSALSFWAIIILAAVAFLVAILVLLINGKTIRSGFSFVGMTLLLSGLVMDVVAGIGMLTYKNRILGSIPAKFIDPLLINILIIGSCILVVGLLIFVIGRAICTAAAKKKLAAAEN
ncbi:MAG: hypothetical protein J5546_04930, partial [Lachnospiraceae bacterium]|nr:hypothetical protein [Lachnospiraceae bacterium]